MTRLRIVVLALVSALCLSVAGGYVWSVRQTASGIGTVSPVSTADPARLIVAPHVVFRNAVLGADYARVGIVARDDPGGPRAIVPVACQRVYATTGSGVCVTATQGVAPTYGLTQLGADLRPTSTAPLVGEPSRARMSTDGTLIATTTFVSGHSYAATTFSTETVIRRAGVSLGNLEDWATRLPNGTDLRQLDRNYWGVTFAPDDDTFFATAASGGATWLVRGSIAAKTMTALRTDAECPSLSPDGRRVAYKKRLGNPALGRWRLAVLDLASQRETVLAETRSVDDQAEWLDDGSLLYALPREGTEATTSDVWVVPADGSGTPTVFIPHASSPAVVRT